MPARRLIKHNPLFMSDDELEEAFVVRTAELQILADLVRANKGEVNQHTLVIGPRGMGKTLLMRRLALLVRSEKELNDSWYPIVAPEEIYDAGTEGEIWLAILKSLADQQRREKDEFERWNERHEALVMELDEERLRARTLGALTEFSHERGKRLLVLIENLQMLLGEQFAKDADWDLRKTLLNRPEIMLVLSATTRFEQIEQRAFAAYELFRELELKPLSTDDCRRLWHAVSGQDLTDQRIRPMEILTGGNPRLLAILATFAPERPLEELMENLAELIDDHTPFLKSNIDALPPQERRVFVNLAKLWEPTTARRVGERCRLHSNTVSAVLKSLVNRGVVVERGKEGRGKLYQVAERIYCIYYLMRLAGSEADRMRAFVRFMVPLYGEDSLARSLAEAACSSDGQGRVRFIEGYRELLAQNLPEGIQQRILEDTPSAFLDLPEVKDFLSDPRTAARVAPERPEPAEEESLPRISEELKEAWGLVREAFSLQFSGRPEEAVEVCDQVVRRFSDAKEMAVLIQVAWALVFKGVALSPLGRHEEVVEECDNVARRFSDAEETVLLQPVAWALTKKGDALHALGRHEEAVEACDDVVRRFSDAEDTTLLQPVAWALICKSVALGALGRHEEAIEACDDVVRRFSDAEGTAGLELVAGALNGKCCLFYSFGVGQLEGAIEAGERAVALAPRSQDYKHTLASVYGLAGRWDEAFDQIEQFIDDEAFVGTSLDDMLALIIDAGADGQAQRALNELSGTAAERAMEPLVVALKELAGDKYRAPQEVEEVKTDVLARIEDRRQVLSELRARLRDF